MLRARYYSDRAGNVYDTALGAVYSPACAALAGLGAISARGGSLSAGGVANAFQVAALSQQPGSAFFNPTALAFQQQQQSQSWAQPEQPLPPPSKPWCGDAGAKGCVRYGGVCQCYDTTGKSYPVLDSCCQRQVASSATQGWCGDTDKDGNVITACVSVQGRCLCYDKDGRPWTALPGCCGAKTGLVAEGYEFPAGRFAL